MIKIYTDGSFATKQFNTKENLVKIVYGFLIEGGINSKAVIIEKYIKRDDKLKQYSNIAEFYAIKKAVKEIVGEKEEITIFTDSTTMVSWFKSAMLNKKKKFVTNYHLDIYNYLVDVLPKLRVYITWIPREENKFGCILERLNYE